MAKWVADGSRRLALTKFPKQVNVLKPRPHRLVRSLLLPVSSALPLGAVACSLISEHGFRQHMLGAPTENEVPVTGGPLMWTLRMAIVAFAADGLASVSDLPSVVSVIIVLAFVGAELSLVDWFHRNPLGDLRRVFALVMLRLGQPILWALAIFGIVAV